MPTIAIHRRETVLYHGAHCCARWVDHDFRPLPTRRDVPAALGSVRRVESVLPAVRVNAPALSRLVDRSRADGEPILRLATAQEPGGLAACVVYDLALLGQKGFSMAKTKKPDGPSLFGYDASASASASAYPRAVAPPAPPDRRDREADRRLEAATDWGGPDPFPPGARGLHPVDRSELARLAAQVVREHQSDLVRRLAAYEDAMRRALDHLSEDRYPTARAILEVALDWSPAETAQARGA